MLLIRSLNQNSNGFESNSVASSVAFPSPSIVGFMHWQDLQESGIVVILRPQEKPLPVYGKSFFSYIREGPLFSKSLSTSTVKEVLPQPRSASVQGSTSGTGPSGVIAFGFMSP